MSYFVRRGDRIVGPYSLSKIKRGLDRRKLGLSDSVSKSQSGPWSALDDFLAANGINVTARANIFDDPLDIEAWHDSSGSSSITALPFPEEHAAGSVPPAVAARDVTQRASLNLLPIALAFTLGVFVGGVTTIGLMSLFPRSGAAVSSEVAGIPEASAEPTASAGVTRSEDRDPVANEPADPPEAVDVPESEDPVSEPTPPGESRPVAVANADMPPEPPPPEAQPSQWEKIFTVDEFGDATRQFKYSATIDGDFSNTATAGSNLAGYISVEGANGEFNIYFVLREYGRSPVTVLDNDTIELAVKTSNGAVKTYTLDGYNGTMWFKKLPPTIAGSDTLAAFMQDTEGESEVTCVLTHRRATYRFSIPVTGLRDAAAEVSHQPQ